jgi:DNA-binding response OmpR family regulator
MPSKGKVLVIDDNPDAVEVLRHALTDAAYEVITAYSGEDGLKLIQAERPDCVLLDVMMPGTSGFQVCKTIKHDMGLGLPVVILSAKSGAKDISYARAMGADDYLTKPVSGRKLTAAIDAAISGTVRRIAVTDMGSDKLLVVTHQMKMLSLIRQILEGSAATGTGRYKLVHAESCQHADTMTKTEAPALVVVDGHLPGDGASMLCRSLKTDPKRKHIPVIVLTPSAQDDVRFAWANERLPEPIDGARLLECIKRHLKPR